jgi:hypothetical protein
VTSDPANISSTSENISRMSIKNVFGSGGSTYEITTGGMYNTFGSSSTKFNITLERRIKLYKARKLPSRSEQKEEGIFRVGGDMRTFSRLSRLIKKLIYLSY